MGVHTMTMLRPVGCLLALALSAALPAQAQTTIDMSKITCEQWLAYKVADPDQIAIWLSGWYSSKQNNTLLEVQKLKAEVSRLKEICIRNLDVPLMKVVQDQIDSKK